MFKDIQLFTTMLIIDFFTKAMISRSKSSVIIKGGHRWKNMKGICYIFLFMTFIILYYKNPMYCLVVIAIVIGLYIYLKKRKSLNNGDTSRGLFFRKNLNYQDNGNQINDLATLFMIQQMFDDSDDIYNKNAYDSQNDEKINKIDIIKNEILELLLED